MRTHLLSVLLSVVAVGRSPPSSVQRFVLETGSTPDVTIFFPVPGERLQRADELPSRSHVE